VFDWTINIPTILALVTLIFSAGSLRQIIKDLEASKINHEQRIKELEEYKEECHIELIKCEINRTRKPNA